MNKKQFIEEIKKLNIQVDENQLDLLNKYYQILRYYNEHTNLTRIIEEEDVYLKHFYDSLTIVKIINFEKNIKLLDIGSGAGFPGIVLKIFFPNLKVTCLDSNNKKTKFLNYLSEELNLEIEVVNERAENYVKRKINSFDIVTARAVANLRILIELCNPFIKKDGYFIAMKGILTEELKDSKSTIEKLNLEIEDTIKFNLPLENSERTIIKLKKNKDSKLSELRPYDKIIKKSL